MERRNYWSRSLAYSRVVEWLKQQRHKRHGEDLPPTIHPGISERILKRLAWRGLAKNEAGKWAPTSALIRPAKLEKVDR